MAATILVLAALVAGANGANDVGKGVATLSGAGTTSVRAAVIWGTVATLAGSVASIGISGRLAELFSSGIVDLEPTAGFAAAVLVGVATWVAIATATRLPVSTTHAIVGALVGAGLASSPAAVAWPSLALKVAVPLVVGGGVAFTLSTVVNAVARRSPECVCIVPAPALGFSGATPARVTTGTTNACRAHGRGPNTLSGAHWASSGAASFARGLNDTSKIAAIAAFALIPAGWSAAAITAVIGGAMAVGSLAVGHRVARRLANDVVRMNGTEGLRSSLVVSVLVGVGANQGLPLSTTHVATGAIAGATGGRLRRVRHATLGRFALAWFSTIPIAGFSAAAALAMLG